MHARSNVGGFHCAECERRYYQAIRPLDTEAEGLGWIWLPVLFVAILIALVLGVIMGWL